MISDELKKEIEKLVVNCLENKEKVKRDLMKQATWEHQFGYGGTMLTGPYKLPANKYEDVDKRYR